MRFPATWMWMWRSRHRFQKNFLRPCVTGLAAVSFCVLSFLPLHAQTKPWADRIASALIAHQPSSGWDAETGAQLEGLDAEWYDTANGDYFRYVKRTVDAYLEAGAAAMDKLADKTAEEALLGKQLLLLHEVTLDPKYYEAASVLRKQLAGSCGLTTAEHEAGHTEDKSSRNTCVAAPFLAEYASVFKQAQDFSVITKGLMLWNDRTKQGQAESAHEAPIDSGDEAQLAKALVDSVAYYRVDDPGRQKLVDALNRVAADVAEHQDRVKGKPDSRAQESASLQTECFHVYVLLKGVRLGLLPTRYAAVAEREWDTILNRFVLEDASGAITLRGSDQDDQQKKLDGTGELLLAATEAQLASTATLARGDKVLIDAWYNSQQRKDATGRMDYFHYKWSDMSDSGYSLLAHMFQSYGAATDTLYAEPTKERLNKAQFYLIVSPDIPVKNPNPHYMSGEDAEEIAAWVHDGGVLILMENDPPNADIAHLNLLADRFGIHFEDVLHHHILGEHVEDGRIPVAAGGPLFQLPHTLYMKDTCAITLRGAGTALLRDRGDIVMASVKFGRGTVFAVVDPWVYNEYTDGRKNPQIYNQFDNFAGGQELVRWLIEQRPRVKTRNEKEAGKQKK